MNWNYPVIFVSAVIGAYVGFRATIHLLEKNTPPEGDMPENWWECTSCGFTTSHEPMGQCPVCKFNGHTVPK